MFTEDLYEKILNRNDLVDIPILVIAKAAIATIEEMLNLA